MCVSAGVNWHRCCAKSDYFLYIRVRVFKTTFNNISAISWWLYSECKSSYIIYFIDFNFLCNNYVFHCRTLNVIFYCNDVGTVTLLWNKYFYYIDRGEIQRFLSEIKINKSHLFHSRVLSQDFSSPVITFLCTRATWWKKVQSKYG
jgi:hypothetical protein